MDMNHRLGRVRGLRRQSVSPAGSGRRRRRQQGFTLIEILVATMLLLLATAGIVPFFLAGLSHASSVRYNSIATNIAREKLEEIRQLDYREIMENTGDPTNPRNLSVRFGDSVYVPERNMTFSVDYEVDQLDGRSRSVQVTVSWTGPPVPVSEAVVKTVVAEQYLGPKMGWLDVWPTFPDNLDTQQTPFRVLRTDGGMTNIQCHIAESDWFLAYDSLSLPLPSPHAVFVKYLFRDSAGVALPERELDNTALETDDDGQKVTDIYFEDTFDARQIPDGYWDLQATMYNSYGQPGNTWILRFRVEQGPPAAPTPFTALGTSDTTVALSWTPGPERDRLHYVLQRREVNGSGDPLPNAMGDWTTVAPELPPGTTSYIDKGALDPADPSLDVPPCGRVGNQRHFEYRIYGVDTGGRSAPDDSDHAASARVALGGVIATTKVVVPSVTGLSLSSAKLALDGTKVNPGDPASPGLGWTVTEVVNALATPGTVLTQNPVAGTLVEQGTAVALTVAIAQSAPVVNYTVTFKKSNNPEQRIYVHNADKVMVYTVSMRKQTNDAVVTLPNGHYNISLSSTGADPFQSFQVNGANLTVTIP